MNTDNLPPELHRLNELTGAWEVKLTQSNSIFIMANSTHDLNSHPRRSEIFAQGVKLTLLGYAPMGYFRAFMRNYPHR